MKNQLKAPELDLALPVESGILDLKSQDLINKEPKDRIKAITSFIKRIEDELPESNFSNIIVEILTKIPLGGKLNGDDIIVGEEAYHYLDLKDKRKLLVYKIKKIFAEEYNDITEYQKSQISLNKYIQKNFKELNTMLKSINYFGFIITKVLERYAPRQEKYKIFIEYINLVISQTGEDKTDVCQTMEDYCTKEETHIIFNLLEKMKLDEKALKLISDEYKGLGVNEHEIINGTQNGIQSDKNENLLNFEEVNDGRLSLNLHIIPLTIINGSKIFGIERTRLIYKNYFDKIINHLVNDSGGIMPKHNGIFSYRVHTLNSINKRLKIGSNESQDTKDNGDITFQNNIIWELEDFSDKDFINLGIILKSIDPTINVSNKKYKDFDKKIPLPIDGDFEYKGHFCLNAGLDDTNLILLLDKKSGKKYVRLSLAGTDQDGYIYILSQISYYIKHKKTIQSTQLYSNIYHQYNVLRTAGSEQFNIKFFHEQYKNIIKHLIFPLSTQHFNKYGKMGNAKNSLLVGLYGTGKSQFLIELLRKKEFSVNGNGEVLNLNANVISLSILEFMELLKSETNGFKNRLTEIYENTRIPIILIIEDLDTMVNENGGGASLYTQALTLFFEGVGHYPIKVVTTTNYPKEFPTRLLRPNRIDNVISFPLPLDEEVLKEILKDHYLRNGLEEHISFNWLEKYSKSMEYFTPSHIGCFVKLLKIHIDFESEFEKDYKITEQEIENIFNQMPLPLDDIKRMQKDINIWLDSLKKEGNNASLGFITKNTGGILPGKDAQARKK